MLNLTFIVKCPHCEKEQQHELSTNFETTGAIVEYCQSSKCQKPFVIDWELTCSANTGRIDPKRVQGDAVAEFDEDDDPPEPEELTRLTPLELLQKMKDIARSISEKKAG